MPKIEQYDWDKLKPKTPENKQTHGTQNFSTYSYKEPRKGSKHGAVKTTRPPKAKKWDAKDKTLGNDWYDHNQHLRSIMSE